jgi:hypothetical protein
MTLDDLKIFNQAITLAENGKKTEAHALLEQLLQAYPDNVRVWLCLVFTASRLEDANLALAQARQLEPHNPAVAQAQKRLAQWEAQERPRPRQPHRVRAGSDSTNPKPNTSEFTPNLEGAAALASLIRYNTPTSEPSIPYPTETPRKRQSTKLPEAGSQETGATPGPDEKASQPELTKKCRSGKRLLTWIGLAMVTSSLIRFLLLICSNP